MNVPSSDEMLLMRAVQQLEQKIDAFGDRMDMKLDGLSKSIEEFDDQMDAKFARLGQEIDSFSDGSDDGSILSQLRALHDIAKRAYAPH